MIEPGTVVEIQHNITARHIQGLPPGQVLILSAGERAVVHGYPDRPDMPVEIELVERPDLDPPTVYVPRDAIA